MNKTLLSIATALAAATTAAAASVGGGGFSPGLLLGSDGVRAPGGTVRYVTVAAGSRTTVKAVRVGDDRVLRATSVRGRLGIPLVAFDGTPGGLSADRRTLVLASWVGPDSTVTRFAVFSTPALRLLRTLTLDGRFGFDALSPDGRTLFVNQYVARQDPTRYRVRTVDLATGRLDPGAVVDKASVGSAMRGVPLTRATATTGRNVYTLYRNVAGPAFVHALDTVRRSSICIELPWAGAAQDRLSGARLSLRRGDRELVVTHRRVGVLAVIDTQRYRVRAVAQPVSPA